MCHTVTLFSLTQKAMLGDLPDTLEHILKVHRKVRRGISRKFHLKNRVFSEYSNSILSFIFHLPQLLLLLLTNSLDWCVVQFSLTHRARLGKSFKYLEKVCEIQRKFLRAFENEVAPQKVSFCQAQNEVKS